MFFKSSELRVMALLSFYGGQRQWNLKAFWLPSVQWFVMAGVLLFLMVLIGYRYMKGHLLGTNMDKPQALSKTEEETRFSQKRRSKGRLMLIGLILIFAYPPLLLKPCWSSIGTQQALPIPRTRWAKVVLKILVSRCLWLKKAVGRIYALDRMRKLVWATITLSQSELLGFR